MYMNDLLSVTYMSTLRIRAIKRNVPLIFVRFIKTWYCTQSLIVRWNGCYSSSFKVSNGVRQGGILSPLLFSIYMDNLSTLLNNSKVGCFYNGFLYNHLVYADDTAIFAPSARALQSLLGICNKFSLECDIQYNVKKSVCMVAKPKSWKIRLYPTLYLNGRALDIVDKYNYLGYQFDSDLNDNDSILKHCRSLYIRGNTIVRNFRNCTQNVKCELFRSYCSSFYCSHLWYKYNSTTARRLHVAYKAVFRNLFNLNFDASISMHMLAFNVDVLQVILRRNVFSFKKRLLASSNSLINVITQGIQFHFSDTMKAWDKMLYVLT